MPSRDHSRSTPHRSVFATKYQGDPGEPQLDRRRSIGKQGYYECPECGNWVSLKLDGNLRAHRTRGLANVTCLYSGLPMGQIEKRQFHYRVTVTIDGSALVSMEDMGKPYPQRMEIIKDAVAASMPETVSLTEGNVSVTLLGSELVVVSVDDDA